MAAFHPVFGPAADPMLLAVADIISGCAVGDQAVGLMDPADPSHFRAFYI
jgi:hypothetical protein